MLDPRIVFFSSVTENTRIFVEQLAIAAERLPLRPGDDELQVAYPYVLFVPTYGAGRGEASVPPQVKKFLKNPEHRKFCIGVIGAGNLNFGEKYAAAGDVVAAKLGVPVLARFELRGTKSDVEKISNGIRENWEKLLTLRSSSWS